MSAAMAQLGLLRLQHQLDAWRADNLTIAVTSRVTYTLPSGTQTVTIGDGGTIDTIRPTSFVGINYIVPGSDPEVEVPLGELDDEAYTAKSLKTLTSSLPTEFYFNPTTPLGTLWFWPEVTQNVDLALYLPLGVAEPTTLNSTMVGPAGYQEAFMLQLAMRLCRPFGKAITQDLRDDAVAAFAVMTRPNNQPPLLSVDAALVPRGAGYNVYSDEGAGGSRR